MRYTNQGYFFLLTDIFPELGKTFDPEMHKLKLSQTMHEMQLAIDEGDFKWVRSLVISWTALQAVALLLVICFVLLSLLLWIFLATGVYLLD